MEFNEFLPGRLFAGTKPDSMGWRTLRKLNIGAILDISDQPDHAPADFPPIPILYFKLGNKEIPTLQQLNAFVRQVMCFLEQGVAVYVHDISGRNRLGFFMTALYMQMYHLPFAQALEAVRRKRPQLSPRGHFVKLLQEYQRCVR
jgi:protein-tyrosine phosphatase